MNTIAMAAWLSRNIPAIACASWGVAVVGECEEHVVNVGEAFV